MYNFYGHLRRMMVMYDRDLISVYMCLNWQRQLYRLDYFFFSLKGEWAKFWKNKI